MKSNETNKGVNRRKYLGLIRTIGGTSTGEGTKLFRCVIDETERILILFQGEQGGRETEINNEAEINIEAEIKRLDLKELTIKESSPNQSLRINYKHEQYELEIDSTHNFNDTKTHLVSLSKTHKQKCKILRGFFSCLLSLFTKVLKLPFLILSCIMLTLEKFGEKTRNPFIRVNKTPPKPKAVILNPATGFLLGTSSIIKELVEALTGVLTEPVRSAQKEGMKGIPKGIAKGLYGLIFKPVAGTIDLVTFTYKGVESIPHQIHKNVFKIMKKGDVKKKLDLHHENDLKVLKENDKEVLFVSKNDPLGLSNLLIDPQIGNSDKELKGTKSKYIKNKFNGLEFTSSKVFAREDASLKEVVDIYMEKAHSENFIEDEMVEFIMIKADREVVSGDRKFQNIGRSKKTEEVINITYASRQPYQESSATGFTEEAISINPKEETSEDSTLRNNMDNNFKEIDLNKIDIEKKMTIEENLPDEEDEEVFSKELLFTRLDLVEFRPFSKDEILAKIAEPLSIDCRDEPRFELSHKSGGRFWSSIEVKLMRNVATQMIRDLGRKLLSGNLNLTTVSFPIKAMIPRSALENSLIGTTFFPIYMNKAALETDPVERFKLVITSCISSFYLTNSFYKPLDAALGETIEAGFHDGTRLYAEQISSSPSVTYFLAFGPERSYQYSGYYLPEAKAGLNSLKLLNHGIRKVKFKDGNEITYGFSEDHYNNTFFGTLRHENKGKVVFQDKLNQLECDIVFGNVKKKPSDYFSTQILKSKLPICKIYGTYLGYLDFDGRRLWDFRKINPIKVSIYKSSLESDQDKRLDKTLLRKGMFSKAQAEKERIESIQREDEKLRSSFKNKKKKK